MKRLGYYVVTPKGVSRKFLTRQLAQATLDLARTMRPDVTADWRVIEAHTQDEARGRYLSAVSA